MPFPTVQIALFVILLVLYRSIMTCIHGCLGGNNVADTFVSKVTSITISKHRISYSKQLYII